MTDGGEVPPDGLWFPAPVLPEDLGIRGDSPVSLIKFPSGFLLLATNQKRLN